MWEKSIPVDQVREIRGKTTVFLGAGAIDRMDDIVRELTAKGIRTALVVTGRGSYRSTGAWDKVEAAFRRHGMEHVLYDRITPNPTVDSVDEAAALARGFGAACVVAIGGGSPIDAAKSVAVLLEYPERDARDLYEMSFVPTHAAPLVAVNLTHGTGTEVDRFAVVSIPEKEYKPAIAYDCLYPAYAVDDPSLMTALSPDQTRYVSIDAVNHVLEAATSKVASPFTVLLGQEVVRLVSVYLPRALANPKDLEARYYLLYASLIAGMAFDNGLLHCTHALEHPLSAVKPDLAHGLGLATIVPGVVRHCYAGAPERFAAVLAPVVPGLAGVAGEADRAAEGLERWLFSLGVPQKLEDLGFSEGDLDKLVRLARTTPSLDGLLSLSPVEATDSVLRGIYRDSLRPLQAPGGGRRVA